MPFVLGWWAYTFPLGTYALVTLRLFAVYPIGLFAVLGVVLVAVLAILWIIVAVLTLRGACKGELFVAPCLHSD